MGATGLSRAAPRDTVRVILAVSAAARPYSRVVIALPEVEIAALCRRYHVRRLWLFGSAATEEFDPEHSDVDFLVEYEPDTDLGPWIRDYFELREHLEALLGRGVDLVMSGASRNPYFLESVERQKRQVFVA